MVGDLKYEGPLVASGAIFLAGGPLAATIAAVIGAAVGGVILWARVGDAAAGARAREIMTASDAANVHATRRDASAGAAARSGRR